MVEVWAESGSSEDVQAAIDIVVASGGGTVHIPVGDFTFNISQDGPNNRPAGIIGYGGINIIGAGIDSTILRTILKPDDDSFMFCIDGSNAEDCRISGISFISYPFTEEADPYTNGVWMGALTDYRIDNCYFENFCGHAIKATGNYAGGDNRGLIDHCIFDNPYHDDEGVIGIGGAQKRWGYGIIIDGCGYESCWLDIDDILGQYDDVTNLMYIEDCTFTRCRHAVAGSTIGSGFYVLRYSDVSMPRWGGIIDVHGAWFESPYTGGRGLEAYSNTIDGSEWTIQFGSHCAFLLRGGGGVVYDNTINDTRDSVIHLSREDENPICAVDDLWIWDNDITDCGPLIYDAGDYTEGEDYHLSERSGYTPYQYPHPLQGEIKMEQEQYDRLKARVSAISRTRAQWSEEKLTSALLSMIDEILDALAP